MLLLINALQTFGYRCQRFSLSMTEACLPPHLSEQLMHWLCRIQRLWRRSVLAPVRGEFSISFFLLVSSSTFGNSRPRNGKGSCADRPRNQTGSRMSAGIKKERQLAVVEI